MESNPSGTYFEIRVKGQLGQEWADWLDGLELRLLENGEMVLFGPIVDQAALLGVLNKLNRLNLAVISVQPVTAKSAVEDRPDPGFQNK